MIFTFWEGPMPKYVELCMKTWANLNQPYTLVNYENLRDYTDLKVGDLKKFTLPQAADIVRVHLLRDNGGIWMDADTIVLKDELPKTNMIGYPFLRNAHIGFLRSSDETREMFREWAEWQETVIKVKNDEQSWDIVGNRFSDKYIKNHDEVSIGSVWLRCPEVNVSDDEGYYSRKDKYIEFYFNRNHNLLNVQAADILMLHNSWTPDWYKHFSEKEVLDRSCTLSNILRGILG